MNYLIQETSKLSNISENEINSWFIKLEDLNYWEDNSFQSQEINLFCIKKVFEQLKNEYNELRKEHFMAALYVVYTYYGEEISYPSRPFRYCSKKSFWNIVLNICNKFSSLLFKINFC